MLNIQPIEKIEKPGEVDDGGLDVHSIFPTIQGEGPFVGQPAIFVRLAGCNLQCPMCDTDYTSGRSRMSIPAIVDTILDNVIRHFPLIVITGGEPFRQRNLGAFVNTLIKHGRRVQIETNGTMYQPDLPYWSPDLTIVCSPKTAKLHRLLEANIHYYKYVIRAKDVDLNDGLPIHALDHHVHTRVARPRPGINRARVYVQPCDLQDTTGNTESLAETIHSCRYFGYTLCLQTHKIIHLP